MTIRAAGGMADVEAWLAAASGEDGPARLGLADLYGNDRPLCRVRCARLRNALAAYRERFGNGPVRAFRAPGRINLRGMHVDTHGGYLNLMTHQREVLAVAGLGAPGVAQVLNTDGAFAPLTVARERLPRRGANESWGDFIARGDVRDHVQRHAGSWQNYVEGAWLRAELALGAETAGGLNLVVDSDLPRGAALSSSAALCVALLQAWFGCYGGRPDDDGLILAAQDAEWYTGSRCGTCDQAAIVLGRPGNLIHGALFPKAFSTAGMSALAFPEDLRVLVINSYTRRSISGDDRVAYTRNRFAYSMAMAILQQTLRAMGHPEALVAHCDRLSHLNAETLGGDAALYSVLQQIPESLDLETLRVRYDLPDLDGEYARYFGDVAHDLRPAAIGLRGALLYGIAESERARAFPHALARGDYAAAGQLMTWGHDGDRRIDAEGRAVEHPVDDGYLARLTAEKVPIVQCPGAYGASSPALDRLVDCALAHGALGASLTGAGIAGTVLALCHSGDAPRIADGIREFMAGDDYRHTAGLAEPLSTAMLDAAAVANHAVSGAGEIYLRGTDTDPRPQAAK